MKIEGILPIFKGFYGSIFDADNAEDFYLESEDKNFDDVDFDYEDYRERVARSCVDSIEDFLKSEGFSIKITFDKVHSPRFYNFTNDEIYCTYEVNDENFNRLVTFISRNLSSFETFLDERYSSRPGFISFYSNDSVKWFSEYMKPDYEDIDVIFRGMLEFYLTENAYTEEDMYYDNQEINLIYEK